MRDGHPAREDGTGGRTAPHDEPDLLRDQFKQLLRYRAVIVLGVLLGVAGSGYLAHVTADTYTADSEVVVREPATDPFEQDGMDRTDMGSERRTALSDSVAARAAAILGVPEDQADDLTEDLQVTNPPNTQVLAFSATADSPDAAADHANAFVRAYLAHRQETADNLVAGMVSALQEQRGAEEERLVEQDADVAELDEGSRAYDEAVTARTATASRIGDLDARVSDLNALDTAGGWVITRADPPEDPSGPGTPLLLALGVAVGAGLGLLGAWVRLVFDPRVRSAGDVSRALRAPVLGILPRTARPAPGQLLAEGRLAEEFRSVAFRLAYDEAFAQRRRLLVVAPRGEIGTPLVASVNLSAAFAEMGMDALLIEADLRTPSLTEQLRQADGVQPGWVNAPGADGDWPTGLRVPIDAGESGVFDLVPGRRVRNVPRALTSGPASRLIGHADVKGAVVTVLAPAVLSYADAIALTDRVDGVLVVCDPHEVRRDDLARVRELVVGAGGLLLGAVLHSWGSGGPTGAERRSAPEEPAEPDGPAEPPPAGPRIPPRQRSGAPERQRGGLPYRDVGADTMGLRVLESGDGTGKPSGAERHPPGRGGYHPGWAARPPSREGPVHGGSTHGGPAQGGPARDDGSRPRRDGRSSEGGGPW